MHSVLQNKQTFKPVAYFIYYKKRTQIFQVKFGIKNVKFIRTSLTFSLKNKIILLAKKYFIGLMF